MDLPVVPGDELLGVWVCGQDGQYAVAAPLLTFFIYNKVSADSPEAINSPNFLELRLEQCLFGCLHAHNLFHSNPGAKTGDNVDSHNFLWIIICRNASVCLCFRF